MTTTLVVSSFLLVALLGVRHVEVTYSRKRKLEFVRMRLDRFTLKIGSSINKAIRRFIEYVHKDVLLNMLHMVTYSALVCVRFLEKTLLRVTVFLRSFKKKKKKNATVSEKLHSIMRESKTLDNDKHKK